MPKPAHQSIASNTHSNIDDAKLVTALRNDDISAFNTIYAKYADYLLGFATKQFRSADLAQEAVQEVFVTLWEKRSGLTIDGSKLRSYLYSAAFRRAADHARHERVMRNSEVLQVEEMNRWMAMPSMDPSNAVLEKEFLQFIKSFISDLTAQQRTLMHLRWQSKLNYDEIAEILGITPAAAQKQASRLALALRAALKALE